MNETLESQAVAESSSVLWLLGLLVMFMAAHVAFGYLRRARYAALPGRRLGFCGAAALALGTGMLGAMLLGVSSQALPYGIGYRPLTLLGAWALAVAGAALTWALLLRWPRPLSVVGSGLLLAGVALGLQVLTIRSAGLRPGLVWKPEVVVLSALLASGGYSAALWAVTLGSGRSRRSAAAWRWGAAGLLAVAVVAGQELVLAAVDMLEQRSSDFQYPLQGNVLSLLASLALPMLLLILEVDLGLRRGMSEDPAAPPRRRRRVRVGRRL